MVEFLQVRSTRAPEQTSEYERHIVETLMPARPQ
jgi:hypothetical protein